MPDISTLKKELQRRMGTRGPVELAEDAGLPRDAVRDIFRDRKPNVFTVAALARQFGCSVDALLGDNESLPPHSESYSVIKRYDARAAAGAGAEGGDDVTERVFFPKAWLRSMTQADQQHLALIEMEGDSMEPTLRSGDQGLVDLTQRNPQAQPGIYVIFTEGGLQVKRLSAHPISGRLRIASDNPAYPSYDDVKPKDVRVIGRVIWIGRHI